MNKKKLIIIFSIIIGVLLVAAVLFLIFRDKNPNDNTLVVETATAEQTQTITITPLASLTATKTATKTAIATITVAAKSDQTLISEALSEKFSQTISSLTISKQSENAAYGSFSLGQEGGYFVAVRDGAGWKIIADGNGTIECSILDANNVPASVVGQCYDTPSETSKTR